MNSISTRELKYLPVLCVLDKEAISNQAHKRSRFRFSHPPLSVQRFGAGDEPLWERYAANVLPLWRDISLPLKKNSIEKKIQKNPVT